MTKKQDTSSLHFTSKFDSNQFKSIHLRLYDVQKSAQNSNDLLDLFTVCKSRFQQPKW